MLWVREVQPSSPFVSMGYFARHLDEALGAIAYQKRDRCLTTHTGTAFSFSVLLLLNGAGCGISVRAGLGGVGVWYFLLVPPASHFHSGLVVNLEYFLCVCW